MPFQCPECSTKTLKITHKLELPPDSRSDEITLQIIECSGCGFGGIAVYEESRRGALDDDSFDHTGYRVGAFVHFERRDGKPSSFPRRSRS